MTSIGAIAMLSCVLAFPAVDASMLPALDRSRAAGTWEAADLVEPRFFRMEIVENRERSYIAMAVGRRSPLVTVFNITAIHVKDGHFTAKAIAPGFRLEIDGTGHASEHEGVITAKVKLCSNEKVWNTWDLQFFALKDDEMFGRIGRLALSSRNAIDGVKGAEKKRKSEFPQSKRGGMKPMHMHRQLKRSPGL